MTCECDPNDNGIVELDVHNINAKNVQDSFLSTLKNTNYKVMICYNLVFNFKIFCHNYGSIITLILFIIYVGFMIYFIIKNISPLKISISKLLLEEKEKEKENLNNNLINPSQLKVNNYAKSTKSTKSTKSEKSVKSSKSKKNKQNRQAKSVKESFPPKRVGNVKKGKPRKNIGNIKDQNRILLVDVNSIKNNEVKEQEKKINTINEFKEDMIPKTSGNLIDTEKKTAIINKSKKVKFKDNKNEKEKENKVFDNYELNNMEYYDACKYDKRSCLKTYWTVLLREHYVIFTFSSRNDYNLFYIKIERFLILICTEITMNGMFFVHETMYKKQTGGLSFAQKIPQIIFSLLVSHAVEIILCFLSMTDKHFYQIKALPKEDDKRDEKIVDILDCIRRKLTGFFIFTFLFFLFHWYFISAFCAVYQNTQLIYLRDSAIGILTSLIDPFIIYGITCILRVISLCGPCRKRISCVYKLSDLLPIF